MLCFASMDACTKYIARDFTVAQILFVRSVVFVVLAAAFAHYRGGMRRALISRRPWLQIGRSALAVAENAAFVLAFRYLPLADTHAVAASSPLIVVALSAPLLAEAVGLDRWLAVGAGFAGVLLIIRPGFTAPHPALLIPLVGAAMWGLYQILTRLCGRTDSGATTVLYSAWVMLVITAVFAVPGWIAPSGFEWGLLIVIALLGCFGHLALIFALAVAEAAAIQPYSYTLLLWVSVLGVVVFGDVPDAWTIAGGAVVVLSGLFAWYRERFATRAATP
jgi:drug/metabolite transporter (DMT)-like permease